MQEKPLKIYNASAGSGKTYTLVQEYLRIILNSKNALKFRSIIAMTFTNKAATEMKERILDSLIRLSTPLAEKDEKSLQFLADTSKNLKLSRQLIEARSHTILNKILHNYGSFSVMTIDKFTHKIIRTFAKDLNLSIDFDVELDIKQLRKDVTALLFDQIGRNPELTKLMLNYAQSNLAEDKTWNFSEQLFNFSDEVFKESAIHGIEKLKEVSTEGFLEIQKHLAKAIKLYENQLSQIAKEAVDLAKSKNLDQDDFKGKSRSILPYFEKISAGKSTDPPSNTLLIDVGENDIIHKSSPNKNEAESIAPLLIQYFHQLMAVMEQYKSSYILNKKKLSNLNNLSLLKHLLETVEKIKEEENILLITDFYKRISEIIIEEPVPFIYERLGVRYEHFLLDEFQDTSHLQWINMIPLVHNSLASEHTNLIVGDGKQAIYRWRNGEVEQFTRLPEEIYNPSKIQTLTEAAPLFEALGKKYPLTENYRSAPEIVAFNNAFFTDLAQKSSEFLKSIYADIKQTPTKSFTGYVEALVRPELSEKEQLNYITKTVQKSLEKGYHLRDICILTYRKKPGSIIARHLAENGYKVISAESLFISKDLGVKFITSVIGSIVYPGNKNHKIKALEHYANSRGGMDPKSLLDSIGKDLHHQSIQEIFAKFGLPMYSPNQFHNMYEFVDVLIQAYLPNNETYGIDQNPYLQCLLEQVHLFERHNNSSLRDFIDWYFERGFEKSIVSPDGANAINVMTIHKSKGLQFPIVICANFDWKMELHKQIAWVEEEKNELPAYFVKMSKDLEETDLAELFETESGKFDLDNVNLLYVAFTRAENALFILGDSKKIKSPAKEWLAPFFSHASIGKFEEDTYQFGDFISNINERSIKDESFNLVSIEKKMDKPMLSFQSAENWDVNHLDAKRLFGSKVHLILSKMNNFDDLETVLLKSKNKGDIYAEDLASIRSTIHQLFEDPHFAEYYSYENVLNEREFITEKGKKLIPDKILLDEHKTIIVDFKTGQESPKHIEQVLEYIQMLNQAGFENVQGELYYTESKKAIRI
jgi:ATP-dependent exoDNAse (exonuclease V) beta subunit